MGQEGESGRTGRALPLGPYNLGGQTKQPAACSTRAEANMATKQRIAILGWGSLLWDDAANKRFDRWHDRWRDGGPRAQD